MPIILTLLLLNLAGAVLPQPAAAAEATPAYKLGERLPQGAAPAAKTAFREIKWEELVPADWDPRELFKGINLQMLDDSDPRATVALEKLREVWRNAPANAGMNGARVRISGFIVPLERKGKDITEFLLVPYFGACIHTPPPPSNQIIHVFPARPLKDMATMDAVWASGALQVEKSETGMGNAGYRMKAEVIVPYREPGRGR
jgi:hypothetical protein